MPDHNDFPPRLIAALVEGPRAWSTPAQLADLVGATADQVGDELVDLDVAGWLDVTDGPAGPIVTLSMDAIRALDVELIEHMSEYRWVRSHRRRPNPRALAPALEAIPDRDPLADAALAASYREEFDRIQARRRERRGRRGLPLTPEHAPYPTIFLLGHGLWHWHERDKGPRPSRICSHCEVVRKRHRYLKQDCTHCGRNVRPAPRLEVCTGCKGKDISDSTYCGKCNRWGWDEITRGEAAPRRAEKSA